MSRIDRLERNAMSKAKAKSDKGTTKTGTIGRALVRAAGGPGTNPKSNDNPYRPGGSYHAVVESARKLGVGKMHPFAALLKVFPSAMGAESWKAFKSKPQRNDNGKEWDDKVLQNFTVVCRPDYGLPLRRCGFEVRKQKTADGYTFGLFKLGSADVKAAQSFEIVRKPTTPVEPKKVVKKTAKSKQKATTKSAKKTAPKKKAGKVKSTQKANASKTTIDAGGGIMVDVIDGK